MGKNPSPLPSQTQIQLRRQFPKNQIIKLLQKKLTTLLTVKTPRSLTKRRRKAKRNKTPETVLFQPNHRLNLFRSNIMQDHTYTSIILNLLCLSNSAAEITFA